MRKGNNTLTIGVAGALSALLHLLLAATLVLGLMPDLSKLRTTMPLPSPARMRLVPAPVPRPASTRMPQTQNFVDATGLKEEKPLGPTPNISDRDTALRSAMPGTGDRALPTQEGVKKPGLSFFETPESRAMKPEQPQPAAPAAAEQKPVAPSEQQAREAMARERQPESPGLGLRPRPAEGEGEKARRESKPRPRAESRPPEPAAAPFEFKQDRTAIEGGAAPPGDASVESKSTPLGQYQARIYRAIGSQWRFMVRQQRGLMDLGTVAVTFILRRDGTLADLRVDYNTSSSAMLQTISENSVRLVAPFPPFPESVGEQMGDELPFDVRFTIY